jgi:hypothetical protein
MAIGPMQAANHRCPLYDRKSLARYCSSHEKAVALIRWQPLQ